MTAHDSVLLVARGSTYPYAAAAVAELARTVAAARPGLRVRPAYLAHDAPALPAALAREAGLGYRRAVLVPLLLTDGYHAQVVLGSRLAARTGLTLPTVTTPVLAPSDVDSDEQVRNALVATLAHLLRPEADAVVLAASGTRASRALRGVAVLASALGEATGLVCRPGFLTGGPPTVAASVTAACSAGASRVAVATYLLTPGRYHEALVAQARAAGAVAVAPPLSAAPDLLTAAVLARLEPFLGH